MSVRDEVFTDMNFDLDSNNERQNPQFSTFTGLFDLRLEDLHDFPDSKNALDTLIRALIFESQIPLTKEDLVRRVRNMIDDYSTNLEYAGIQLNTKTHELILPNNRMYEVTPSIGTALSLLLSQPKQLVPFAAFNDRKKQASRPNRLTTINRVRDAIFDYPINFGNRKLYRFIQTEIGRGFIFYPFEEYIKEVLPSDLQKYRQQQNRFS